MHCSIKDVTVQTKSKHREFFFKESLENSKISIQLKVKARNRTAKAICDEFWAVLSLPMRTSPKTMPFFFEIHLLEKEIG